MNLRLILASAALFSAVLGGCATPQYQKFYRHEAPADAQGQACTQACDERKQACLGDCRARYEACLASVEPQVEERYLDALKHYELELREYAVALRHYEMQLDFYWPGYYWYPRFGYGWYPWHGWYPWPAPYWPPARPPSMPTREDVRAALARQQCQEDCGCLSAYDACFTGCGGRIVEETRCIANCPAEPSRPPAPAP